MLIKKINNQAELEAAINEDFAKVMTDEPRIPFGKYKNELIEDVPNYYLDWLLSEDVLTKNSCYAYLLQPVESEIDYRKTFNIYIEGETS